jgi:hypothetical protein
VEEGDGEVGGVDVVTSRIGGVLAMPMGLLLAAFTLVMTTGKGIPTAELVTTGCLAVAFLVSGFLGMVGVLPGLVAGVWTFSLVGLFTLAVVSNAEMGLFEGGLIILFMLFYLVTGTVVSLVGWLRSRSLRSPIG